MDTLNHFLYYQLEDLPYVLLALIVAFTIHEFSHAYAAYKFGDPTAKNQGRVTLNPRAHLDVVGTIFIFIAGFGWAKPVPVMRNRFKHPRLMGVITSAVGPLSNLLVAFIGMLIYKLLLTAGWNPMASVVTAGIELFLSILIHLNIVLFIFNLIPLPPLDGYRIIEDLVPNRIRAKLTQYEQWGLFIFLLLIFIPPLNRMTLGPLFLLEDDVLALMRAVIYSLFG